MIDPLDTVTPVADRIFFVGVEGGFEIAGMGGFTIRLALSELGPLGVLHQRRACRPASCSSPTPA